MNRVRALAGAALLLVISAFGCSDSSTVVSNRVYSERSDSSFAVADSSVLEISNFAGRVNVSSGNPHVVDVVAEKWALRQEDLDKIDLEMLELQNGVSVTTANLLSLSNVSVDLGLTVPTDMRPTIQAGAGDIGYEGLAEGECFFATGAGTITLKLPPGVNVEVHLSVGAGTIRVDFPVVGQVNEHVVNGVIGTGADGRIVAHVGAGTIIVTSQ
jgi:hypothetical protein